MKMHALASQGHLKDISRDVTHDYQRNSCSLEMPGLSTAGAADGVDSRTMSSAAAASFDEYVFSRSTTKETWSLRDSYPADRLTVSDVRAPAAPLQRLESELASLNHARRRLAVDDELGAGGASSSAAVTDPTTEYNNSAQGDVGQPVDNNRNDNAGGSDDSNVLPWISASSFRDVVDAQCRQMSGGSVFCASTCSSTSRFQPFPLPSSTYQAPGDVISSLTSFTDSRFHAGLFDDDASPSKWRSNPVIGARTSTDVENRLEERAPAALPRTPAKRGLPSSPSDLAAEPPWTPVNGTSRSETHFVPLEESSRESHDSLEEDVDALRSNTADHDQTQSTLLSPIATTGEKDSSEAAGDAVKPAFWLTDYKQPKRCKKGNCTFQTVSKMEFWDHLSVHFSDDKLFRCDRCPFRTPLKHHMTSHRMNHDDDKPFSCDLCCYRAVSQSMVNSHKKSHSTVRPYVCDFPHCHYATKFVNQLTKHREKQHPGFVVASGDDVGRRRRQSTSVAPVAAAGPMHQLGYQDDRASCVPPPPQAPPAAAGAPPLPGDVTARNAAPMLPWSMPPWSPFHFLQRMAAAAAVSGLPLYPPPSPLSLPAQRPVDAKPFQLPASTLPSSRSLELVPGERGSATTPQKSELIGRRDLHLGRHAISSLSTTASTGDTDARRSFLARLAAAAAAGTNNQNTTGDDVTTGAPVVPETLAPTAANNDISAERRNLTSASCCLRATVDGVASHKAVGGPDASRCTDVSGPAVRVDVDDRPLDLTAKTSVTAAPRKHAPVFYQPSERDVSNHDHDVPVRKTSRRKGVAHKLDTTRINEWPPADVANEPFDVVPVSTSSQIGSTSQSSPRASLPDRRRATDTTDTTVNGGTCATEKEAGTQKEEDIPASARIQQQMPEIGASSGGDAADTAATIVDVGSCQELDGAVAGPTSTHGGAECRHCGFVFKHSAMFDIHMGFHKFDDPWRCNRCGQRCVDSIDFNRHIATAPHLGQV